MSAGTGPAERLAGALAAAGPPAWLSALAGGPPVAQVFVYDEIGPWGITAAEFAAALPASSGDDVEVHLNSPGGSATDGLAMHAVLSQRRGMVRVVVDSLAASAATLVMMAADPGELVVAPAATVMVHEAWSEMPGRAAELRKQADVLDAFNEVLASVYADRTGLPPVYWREVMARETWYSAQEAVDARLADRILRKAEKTPAVAGQGPVTGPLAPRLGTVLAAADLRAPGQDPYGHPVPVAAKREAFRRYEALKARREAELRAISNGHAAAAARREHSAFARAVFGVE
jgi:ATP-dependent protease ClpP protease subunit